MIKDILKKQLPELLGDRSAYILEQYSPELAREKSKSDLDDSDRSPHVGAPDVK